MLPHGRGPSPAAARPSAHVRELIRRGAEVVLNAPPQWLLELEAVVLATPAVAAIAQDPVLAAGLRRATHSNLMHWARANVRDPGAKVPANVGEEPLAIARDLVRRGLDERALHAHRTGHSAAWVRWMDIAFGLTRDPEVLRELLEVTARSIHDFNEACIVELESRMQAERAELTAGTHAERRATVALLMEGAPIPRDRAERSLGYPLAQDHRAAVLWSEQPVVDMSELEQLAGTLTTLSGAPRALTVVASAATLWLWLPTHREPSLRSLERALRRCPHVKVSLGSAGRGLEGFRTSHLDALTAQRMLARVASPRRLVRFDEVRLVALLTADAEGAEHFVRDTLGALRTAAPELRESTEVFLEEGGNASRAAERLGVHRNTMLRRLEAVDALLPAPLQATRTNVAVALEVLRWTAPSPEIARTAPLR